MVNHLRFLFIACLLTLGVVSAQTARKAEVGPVPAGRPAMIYVADFDLESGEIRSTSGGGLGLSGRVTDGAMVSRGRGRFSKDRDSTASQLVEGMSISLIKELKKVGLDARRISVGTPWPTNGWLIRGVFLQVDEGKRVRRAVVGFGSGKTDLQIQTAVDHLTEGPPRPFYQIDTTADSGKAPGAIVFLNPVAAATRFVMAGGDLQRNVKETAVQIARSVAALAPPSGNPSVGN